MSQQNQGLYVHHLPSYSCQLKVAVLLLTLKHILSPIGKIIEICISDPHACSAMR